MYGHQHTKEPGSAFWGPHGTIPADPSGTTLFRTVHFFSTNQIIVPNNTTAIARSLRLQPLRRTTAPTTPGGFDAASLGYPAYFTACLTEGAFPSITMNGYSNIGHGGRSITNYVGQTANATVSKFMGSHSVKVGVGLPARRAQRRFRPTTATSAFTPGVHAGAEPEHGEQRRRRRVRQLPARLSRQRRRQRDDARHLLHRLLLGVHPGRLARDVER